MVRHFIQVEDFTKEEYLEIFRRARKFQEGGDFTHLCRGKILALMFFQESTRTMAGFQSAIIKLGGGWNGLTSELGTYIASKEEDVENTLRSVANMSDIMVVRHKDFDLSKVASDFPIPLINGMCGIEEHPSGALWISYSLHRRFPKLENIKVGVYGMIKSSRPLKAMIKILSQFGVTIYEDTLIDEFETPTHIREYLKKTGGKLIKAKLNDFIRNVDVLIICEGLPQPGEDRNLVEKFCKKFKPITEKEMSTLRKDAIVITIAPRILTYGGETVETRILKDPRVIDDEMLKESVFVNMALITYLLNISV